MLSRLFKTQVTKVLTKSFLCFTSLFTKTALAVCEGRYVLSNLFVNLFDTWQQRDHQLYLTFHTHHFNPHTAKNFDHYRDDNWVQAMFLATSKAINGKIFTVRHFYIQTTVCNRLLAMHENGCRDTKKA